MPESKDTDWDWEDFLNRNNNELVATWGNLANRVLSFAYKHWDGRVPQPGEYRPIDNEIDAKINASFDIIGDHLNAIHLRSALVEAIQMASEVNKYLDTTAPWFEVKQDKTSAATSIYIALKAIDSLKILLAPFLPFTSEKLNKYLGYTRPIFGEQYIDTIKDELGEHSALRYRQSGYGQWKPSELAAGQALVPPEPLFKKLDKSIVPEERSRLGN
jgi:methionyl-tRNA synthetase